MSAEYAAKGVLAALAVMRAAETAEPNYALLPDKWLYWHQFQYEPAQLAYRRMAKDLSGEVGDREGWGFDCQADAEQAAKDYLKGLGVL